MWTTQRRLISCTQQTSPLICFVSELVTCCADEEDQEGEDFSQDEVTAKLQEPTYFGALQLLCDEAGFLVDSKAHKMLASLPKHQDEQLIQAESVVKALGVTDGASFEALMSALSVDEPEGLGSQSMSDPRLIHPADAVTRLREFVEAENGGAAAATSIGLTGMCASVGLVCSLLFGKSWHFSSCLGFTHSQTASSNY